jgi:hypothetical protein
MRKLTYTDRSGAVWTFRDYRVATTGVQPETLNHHSGEYRAFVAEHSDTILVYRFGDRSYRTAEPNVLEGQLLFARQVEPPKRHVPRISREVSESACLERRRPLPKHQASTRSDSIDGTR